MSSAQRHPPVLILDALIGSHTSALVSLTQVKEATGVCPVDCPITSITSPAASSLLVKWSSFTGATSYLLDARVVNSTSIAPVLVQISSSNTERVVQGLRPGQNYQVTLKVYQFYYVICISSQTGQTVPATSQITFSKAISSTSIRFEWSNATGADKYILGIDKTLPPFDHLEYTFLTTSGQVNNLQQSTAYNCYVYSSNAAGLGAKSLVKTIRTLVQPPNGVNVVKLTDSTARVSWLSVSSVLLYQVTVSANNKSGIPPVSWNSTTLTFDIPNLVPCTTYTVGVSSISMFLEPGEPSNVTYTTPGILPVTVVSADYNCVTGTASVSWGAVFGATSYRAVATDDNGMTRNCTSMTTSCQISMLSCGRQYTVRIVAIADCESTSGESYTFQTASCPPHGASVYRECSSNVIIYSWNATDNTAYYIAMAQGSDGETRECLTEGTSCYFTNMNCGKNYTFTVSSTFSGGLNCNSGNTEPVAVTTAPCLPQNVRTTADCSIGTAIATWDLVEGAKSYVVEARGNRRDFYNCSSQGNSCMLSDLDCGESLSVWIFAKNEYCTTDAVLGEVADTVPCPPQNVSAANTCSSTSASMTWLTSNGAVFYIAVATHSDGTVHTCISMATECEFQGLRCGGTYDAYVQATNMHCNSSESDHITLKTAPCAPVNVGVVKDCGASQATVSWQTSQTGGLYTAVLKDALGPSLNCSTSTNSCTVPNMRCGAIYNVSVTYYNGQCNSLPSPAYQIPSVPCQPQNVTSTLQCETNTATVTWGAGAGATPCIPTNVMASLNCTNKTASVTWTGSLGATGYQVKAESNMGHRTSCNATSTQCDFTDLRCGQQYSITVVAKTIDCMGQSSQPVTLVSAPCPNTNVQARLDCQTNAALISWTPGNGTLRFNATLQSSRDFNQHSCITNSSSCNISSLQCGERYNISVTGYGQTCSSCSTTSLSLDTAPCVPTQVNVSMTCQSDIASVSWTASAGLVLYYVATAESANGQTLTCNSSSTSCNLSGLMCGRAYNVSVTAVSANCTGQRSGVYLLNTVCFCLSAPCAPESVVSQLLDCQTGAVRISWQSSNGSLSYCAKAVSTAGNLTCNSTSTSCVIPAISCGQTYNITVAAQGNGCTAKSVTSQITAGPCPPSSVSAVLLDCSTNTALVSWTSIPGVQYTARANGTAGSSAGVQCNTTNSNCTLTNLQCGSQYNISVTATRNNCSSTVNMMSNFTTAPCAPVLSDAVLNCSSRSANVTWSGSAMSGVVVSVSAVNTQGVRLGCGPLNSQSCVVDGLQCGQTYTFGANATQGQCTTASNTLQRQTGNMSNLSHKHSFHSAVGSTICGSVDRAFLLALKLHQDYHGDTRCKRLWLWGDIGHRYQHPLHECGDAPSRTIPGQLHMAVDREAPCAPQNVTANLNSSSNTATVTWGSSQGAVLYSVTASSVNGQSVNCTSASTSCVLSPLACGQQYTITMRAVGTNYSSEASAPVQIQTAPCAPQNVSANVNCSSNTATVTWGSSQGAMLYSVTASSVNGQSVNCTSASTSCVLSPLACGQRYTVTMRSVGTNYSSEASAPVQIQSVPCTPQNVLPSVDCGLKALVVSWTPSAGGQNYTATLRDTSGLSTTCLSSGSQCNIIGLSCGQVYSVDLTASDNLCTSAPSSASTQSVPCAASSINATLDCVRGTATVSWQNGTGAQGYAVSALSSRGNRATCVSNSSITNCVLSSLQCGDVYTVTVQTLGQTCNASAQMTGSLITAPCAPESVVSQLLDCQTGAVRISWQSSNGSLSYCAKAVSTAGNLTCNSTSTSCVIPAISCGQTYNITVAAQGNGCIAKSVTSQITAGPCPPSSVSAVLLDCSTNTALVSWTSIPGVQYTARANGTAGSSSGVQCNTTNSNCTLTNLQCGSQYNISVTATRNNCSSTANIMSNFTTAPCAPVLSDAVLNCSSRSAMVTWSGSASSGVVVSVSAVNAQGVQLGCGPLNGQSCVVDGLQCGQTYTFGMNATQGQCTSTSNTLQRQTAPCPPQNVSANVNSSSNTATVTWGSSQGAVLYSVTASSVNGQSINCTSASTSCVLSPLACGQQYTVTMRAVGTNYSSEASAPVQIQTAPCPPQNISANVNSSSNTSTVTWGSSQGAVLYSVTASSVNGQSINCTSASTSCMLSPLACGQQYTITMRAVGTNYSSEASAPVQIQTGNNPKTHQPCCSAHLLFRNLFSSHTFLSTAIYFLHTLCNILHYFMLTLTLSYSFCVIYPAPCTPQNVSANVNSSSNTATVTWGSSQGAVLYSVTASSVNGQSVNCTSASTSCILSPLACGQQYTITMRAVGTNHSSEASAPVQIQTAPCPPQNVSANVNCSSNTATVTWGSSQGAVLYSVTASSVNGQSVNCTSASTSCVLSPLTCGQRYTVTMRAVGTNYSSEASAPVQIQSVPCSPLNVLPTVYCGLNALVVSWTPSAGGQNYTATLRDTSGLSTTCQSSGSQCNITGLRCGQVYSVNVIASDNLCTSTPSTTANTQSVPCAASSINATLDCVRGTATVSWQNGTGAQGYAVSALSSRGNRATCVSNSSITNCALSSLQCGDTYAVTVQTLGQTCNASAQMTGSLITAPCAPESVVSQLLDCQTGALRISWQSSNGSLSYCAKAVSTAGNLTCNSTSTSCIIPAISCGQTYNITVAAQGNGCTAKSVTSQITAGPCPPSSVSAVLLDCSSNTALVSWTSIPGVQYTARANGTAGSSAGVQCNTTNSNCTLTNLQCGSQYNISVTATRNNCSSTANMMSNFTTAPCALVLSDAVLNCSSLSANVTWSGSALSGVLVSVSAVNAQGVQLACGPLNGQSCVVDGLQCGQTYTFGVNATQGQCTSTSNTLQRQTAPYPPQNIQSITNISNNTVSVSWSSSNGTVSYRTTLECSNGQTYTCRTNTTGCDITNMPCGQTCAVKSVAEGTTCNSSIGIGPNITTASCAPQNVSANVNCSSNTATVTWGSSQGVVLYSVTASSVNGQSVNCTSASTSCVLSPLACGQRYTVTVRAVNTNYNSDASAPVQIQSVPCSPQNVLPTVDCGLNALVVSWTPSAGGQNYTATLRDTSGLSTTCQSSGSQCNITGLSCGQVYSVDVTASDNLCTSTPSSASTQSVPCAASSINATLDCVRGTATVSWQNGTGAQGYAVSALSSRGNRATCVSNSSITNCALSSLQCGDTYAVTVQTLGQTCNASAQMTGSLITAPCAPESVVSQLLDCQTGAVRISWQSSNGSLSYCAKAVSTAGNLTCNSTSTSCVIPAIGCGQTYNITVAAQGNGCIAKSVTSQITAGPCPPSSVSAVLSDCSSNTALVSWTSIPGVQYTARANGTAGSSAGVQCNTTNSNCTLTNLQCGSQYNISVTATRNNCSSTANMMSNFTTAPCAPVLSDAVLNCSSRSANVTWSGSASSGVVFSVSAVNTQGVRLGCGPLNGQSCVVDGLQCGQTYTFGVNATQGQCTSTSNTLQRQTAPYAPQNIQSKTNCGNNTVSVSWSSSNGTVSYRTTLECSNGQTYTCRTTATGCDITNMPCGQTCTVKSVAEGTTCNSSIGIGPNITTVPCVPAHVQGSVDCTSGNISLSWNQSVGAVSYTATAQGNGGYASVCNSTGPACVFSNLLCGMNYSFSVSASDGTCSTAPSQSILLTTVPCKPQNASAQLNCNTNTAVVTWEPSDRVLSYIVKASSPDGHQINCTSSNYSCTLPSMHCGQNYNVTVAALVGGCCNNKANFILPSAPCAPLMVNGTLDCVTNSAWVSWNLDNGTESYSVLAVSSDGQIRNCSTSNSSCKVADLGCSKIYNFSVTATTGPCQSPASSSFQLETGPCALSSIVAVTECQSSVIQVQWQRAPGGNSLYVATAEGQDRSIISCNSSASSCNLTGVRCGMEYTIIVSASSNRCSSLRSPTYKISTVPCQPTPVDAHTDCQTNNVSVSWQPSYVAKKYTLTVVGRAGDVTRHCTADSNFTLSDLRCSDTYYLSVSASRDNCTSPPSTNITFNTVPCKPANLTLAVNCVNGSALLSWRQSTGAVSYTGLAQSTNGTAIQCQSTNTSCSLQGLVCGRIYNFTVQASDGICNSSVSDTLTRGAVPCPPAGLRVIPNPHTVVNETQILRASWLTGNCPNSEYLLQMKGGFLGDPQALYEVASYWTSRTFFEVPLPCGSSYNATIRAKNCAGSSVESSAVSGTTVPCAPVNVKYTQTTVEWSASIYATNYTVYQVNSTIRTQICVTSQLSCAVTNMGSGAIIVTARNSAGESQDSLPASLKL
ncbi:uncharacterized protein fndc7rs1 [Misgurnus anguillicaudatus]|uniref:uncharacterized protein fndc7rs1 n=1 Tax=Misgurnus anguillicaudatus TaxID=75329 RepID=UPI003CCF0207